MAWLHRNTSGHYYVCFRFGGRRFKKSLKTKQLKVANSKRIRLEDALALVHSGRLEVPPGTDIPTFLLSDGKRARHFQLKDCRIDQLFSRYFESLPDGSLEDSTQKTMKTHQKHLQRILGTRRYLASLSVADLQSYIRTRSSEKGIRGRNVSATTMKKEIATLRSLWNWGVEFGLLEQRPFPSRGLRYPKVAQLPPFQTFSEVVLQTEGLDPDHPKAKDLWSTVFLNREEIEELLDGIQMQSNLPPFVYPIFALAAHTGARRSEIMRAHARDVSDAILTIHEKKRSKELLTTRTVPISTRLREALDAWLDLRPKIGDHLFCHVDSSRCFSPVGDPVTKDEMNHYFEWPLRKTRFKQLLGWHVFRHSFCSNCAAAGIDQRMIDAWVGHTTDEMRRRYRHLFPSKEQQALETVFG